MNGATALDCANTISRPKATKMITIGTSQNFFSCRRNAKNCDITLDFFMMTSKHPLEMRPIAVALGIRRPPLELLATAREWILAEHPPHQRQRNQEHGEQQRQQNARVDVGEHTGKSPPHCARPLQELRPYDAEQQQHCADAPENLGAADTAPPPQRRRDDEEDGSDGDAKPTLRILGSLGHDSYCARWLCASVFATGMTPWCPSRYVAIDCAISR